MNQKEKLAEFVRAALSAGRTRPEIEAALAEAGWTPQEVRDALREFADTEFTPPVPRPSSTVSARDFFIYSVLFISLGMSAFQLNSLIHGLLTTWLPEPGESILWVESQIRWAISTLIVSGPLFAILSWRTNRAFRIDPGRRRSAMRKWLTYIALIIASMVFLGDLIAIVYSFLEGELTLRFVLKAASVGVISGAIFLFYLGDVESDDAR